MNRKAGSTLALIALAAFGLAAQAKSPPVPPKLAVLDAILGKGIDRSAIGAITEKVIEALVDSRKYTVLDRANVEQVLAEREFQLSGLVSDQDVTEAGKYLGAEYVVVIKAELVGDTYFVSGKLITVKTGVIIDQASAEGQGRLSALLGLAEEVGDELADGNKDQPRAAQAPRDKPAKPARKAESPEAGELGPHILASVGASAIGLVPDGFLEESHLGYAIDLFALYPFLGGLSAAANLEYGSGSDEAFGTYVDTIGLYGGLGFVMPLSGWRAFADVKAGFIAADYSGLADFSMTPISIDLGALYPLGPLLVGARLEYSFGDTEIDVGSGPVYNEVSLTTLYLMAGLEL